MPAAADGSSLHTFVPTNLLVSRPRVSHSSGVALETRHEATNPHQCPERETSATKPPPERELRPHAGSRLPPGSLPRSKQIDSLAGCREIHVETRMSMQVGCSSSHNRCPMRPRRARKWRGLKSGQRNSGTARRRAGLGDGYSAEKTTEGLWWKTFKRLWTAKMSAASLSAASRPRLMKRRKPRFSLVSPKTGSTVCERIA